MRLLPPRRESLHIAHIADRSGDSYQEEGEEEEEEEEEGEEEEEEEEITV